MNKTLEMIEKRNQAWNAAKAFVESRRDKDGLLSEADAKTYAEMEQKVRNYSAEIERLQAMEAMDAEMSRPLGTPITGRPMNGSAEDKPVKTGRASDEYRKAMLNALRSNFRQISNVLQEGIDAQGGYLVPEEYDSRLIDALKEENVVRKIAHNLPTSGEHKINIAATKPAAAWIEEGGALSFGEATFDQIILDAHKLHVAIKVTEELLYDSAFPLEQYILDAFTKALANAEEDAFINGTGTGQPLGILAATGGAQVGKTLESTDVTADDVIDLIYSLKRPYRKNAVFLTNDKCVAALRKLKDENGQFLWQPSLQAGTRHLPGLQDLHLSVLPGTRPQQGCPRVRRFLLLQHRRPRSPFLRRTEGTLRRQRHGGLRRKGACRWQAGATRGDQAAQDRRGQEQQVSVKGGRGDE